MLIFATAVDNVIMYNSIKASSYIYNLQEVGYHFSIYIDIFYALPLISVIRKIPESWQTLKIIITYNQLLYNNQKQYIHTKIYCIL